MTVAELIAKLQALPQEAQVMVDLKRDDLVYEEINEIFSELDFSVVDAREDDVAPSAEDLAEVDGYRGTVYVLITRE